MIFPPGSVIRIGVEALGISFPFFLLLHSENSFYSSRLWRLAERPHNRAKRGSRQRDYTATRTKPDFRNVTRNRNSYPTGECQDSVGKPTLVEIGMTRLICMTRWT